MQENPIFDIASLKIIKSKIEKNLAMAEDYAILDNYVSSIYKKDYILNKLKESGFDSYELFRLARVKVSDKEDMIINGTLLGFIYGTIGFLEDYLLKK